MTNRIKGFGNIETCHRVGPFPLSGFPKDTIEGRGSLSPSINPQIDKFIITKRINFLKPLHQDLMQGPCKLAHQCDRVLTSSPTIKLKTSANLDTHREVMIFRDSLSSLFADGSVFKEDNSNSVNHSHSSSGKLMPLIAVIVVDSFRKNKKRPSFTQYQPHFRFPKELGWLRLSINVPLVSSIEIEESEHCSIDLFLLLQESKEIVRSKEYQPNSPPHRRRLLELCRPQPSSNGNTFQSLLRPYTIQIEHQVSEPGLGLFLPEGDNFNLSCHLRDFCNSAASSHHIRVTSLAVSI
ncbi:unnamed protein product [Lepeophtheirus salmonis]|uniref:(salmon louse) hypothetical protein n=1 Tax=Lepeophtheirus salmonis TaxID=72036 RepID=A0A7R8CIW9_LEPSM|nr:unnamed protein product [Lepeophtheirus salmonis]CAF2805446.1 unnamed protein product [Lepeophtheirus salmonis]